MKGSVSLSVRGDIILGEYSQIPIFTKCKNEINFRISNSNGVSLK